MKEYIVPALEIYSLEVTERIAAERYRQWVQGGDPDQDSLDTLGGISPCEFIWVNGS